MNTDNKIKKQTGIPVSDTKRKPERKIEFSIHTELADLPLTNCPFYMTEAVGGVCVSGSAVITAFNIRFRIRPDMIIVLLPWQLVSIREISSDFRITFFRLSEEMFTDSLSSMWRLTPDFFFYMSKHVAFEPEEGNIRRFLNYCDLLEYRVNYASKICRRESIMQLLRVFFWDIYTGYICDTDSHSLKNHYTRKEELAYRFLHMILEEHSPDKDVPYYAGKLNITPKYLTSLIRSLSGHSARDWIVRYMLLEIKSLLRESSMDLKSITNRLHFPDQSTLSRFFRHYTGMTPSQYRKKIFF